MGQLPLGKQIEKDKTVWRKLYGVLPWVREGRTLSSLWPRLPLTWSLFVVSWHPEVTLGETCTPF